MTAGEDYTMDLLSSPEHCLVPSEYQEEFSVFSVSDKLEAFGGEHYQSAKQELQKIIAAKEKKEIDQARSMLKKVTFFLCWRLFVRTSLCKIAQQILCF